jgi:hypothetical protein
VTGTGDTILIGTLTLGCVAQQVQPLNTAVEVNRYSHLTT